MSYGLQQQVLVLNRLWQAVNVCSVERALGLLYTGHAQVVSENEGNFNTFSFNEWCSYTDGHDGEDALRSISLRFRLPQIILLSVFDRLPKKEIRYSKENVLARDKYTCQYCSTKYERRKLNLDHVIPRQQGGPSNWENVVCSCLNCNHVKANRTPEQAGMRLLREPVKPKWRPFLEFSYVRSPDQSWQRFLDPTKWKVQLG